MDRRKVLLVASINIEENAYHLVLGSNPTIGEEVYRYIYNNSSAYEAVSLSAIGITLYCDGKKMLYAMRQSNMVQPIYLGSDEQLSDYILALNNGGLTKR